MKVNAADSQVFTLNALEIWKRGDRYYARYDAGAHQVAMREDEISEAEAMTAMQGGRDGVVTMLSGLQRRLIQAGLDPYISNIGT